MLYLKNLKNDTPRNGHLTIRGPLKATVTLMWPSVKMLNVHFFQNLKCQNHREDEHLDAAKNSQKRTWPWEETAILRQMMVNRR